jgi:two-component system LytT family sensor kinase
LITRFGTRGQHGRGGLVESSYCGTELQKPRSAPATLADELRNTERYLVLEQARFGERLRVSLRVAPEVLPITVPFLVVQPLVENAVRHGLDADRDVVTVSIVAADEGATALLTVEDDGIGADPEVIRTALIGGPPGSGERPVGLSNVDSRLRQVFGDRHGLVVETAPGAGTKVTVHIPKFAPGIPGR